MRGNRRQTNQNRLKNIIIEFIKEKINEKRIKKEKYSTLKSTLFQRATYNKY